MTALRACPEFDCAECGRHVVVLAGPLPVPPLCLCCIAIPGWFDNPALCAVIDAGGHRQPPDLDTIPEWSPAS